MHRRKNNTLTLYAILLVFLVPIVLAHVLYHSGYGKQNHRSKGTLLSPPVSIHTQPVHYWQIASLPPTTSDHIKYQALEKRWQALGRDQARVHLSIIGHPDTATQISPQWESVDVDQETLDELMTTRSKNAKACTIFIINPDHNAIMCYDDENDLKDIDFDLRKLLKLSKI